MLWLVGSYSGIFSIKIYRDSVMRSTIVVICFLILNTGIAQAEFSSSCYLNRAEKLFKCTEYSNHDDFFKDQTKNEL